MKKFDSDTYPEGIIDLDWFINTFNNIPAHLWCRELYDGNKRSPVGHARNIGGRKLGERMR